MTFFEIIPADKEIKIYTKLLKEFFDMGNGISNIVFHLMLNEVIITLNQSDKDYITLLKHWDIIINNLKHLKILNDKVFTYTINTAKNSIELVFDADKGMIGQY